MKTTWPDQNASSATHGYRLLEPDDDGIIRSSALPNFWMPLSAVQERDWWAVLGCIERGVSRRANFS